MELVKQIFFQVVVPMIYLVFSAYALAIGSTQLVKAWKKKSFKLIWLYIWCILITVYFTSLGFR